MEKIMVFDDKAKRRIGLICSVPAAAFLIAFVYYAVVLWPLTGPHQLYGVEGIISRNYDTLFIMLASAAIITAPVFIYCLVLLARLKNMNAAQKLKWVVVLSISAPVASFFFWYFLIRKEPHYVGIYPDIA
jgi:cytochrome c oxidase assembly factor CtaG